MAKDKAQETEAPTPPAPAKSKLSIKKILIMGFLGLLLIGGGLVAYILMTDDPTAGQGAHASQSLHERVTMPLEPFLVNLADKESRRYLKLKVELEVDREATAKELEKFTPNIRDSLILLLSSKTYLDISSLEGKQQLKEEIKKRVAALPNGKKVSNVFFTEFVAQ